MHCCLAVGAAAKLRKDSSPSRAFSVPILNDRSNVKTTDATANDCILHLMTQLPSSRKERGSAFLTSDCQRLFRQRYNDRYNFFLPRLQQTTANFGLLAC
jgi:hypothetical protein